jgi:hypothetical protein
MAPFSKNHNNKWLKTDNNSLINEKFIRWMKKMNECLEVCVKSDGCLVGNGTHKICKINSPDSYNRLNQHYE